MRKRQKRKDVPPEAVCQHYCLGALDGLLPSVLESLAKQEEDEDEVGMAIGDGRGGALQSRLRPVFSKDTFLPPALACRRRATRVGDKRKVRYVA